MNKYYDDGRVVITAESFSTPTRLYPLAHATARIRRDPLWIAISAGVVATLALHTYADLLTMEEIVVIAGLPLGLLILGLNMSIIAIDVPGHQPTRILARASRAKKIFAALRCVKGADFSDSARRDYQELHSEN